ncbi:MAG: UDP-4-amino-4,6-dideoxy-N-acetyl-beta-L-altrosamine transaminase [Planctomycetaceae bacterium]
MSRRLAIEGGTPVRASLLPYGRQSIDAADAAAVAEALASDWLTTGPRVEEFERAFAGVVGTREAVAFCNGTAALHGAMRAVALAAGDEVVVPALTFVASANCVVYEGATPVFADVEPETLLLGPVQLEARTGPRTKAVLGVDYAGQVCEYGALRSFARDAGLRLVADACHSLGAASGGRPSGGLAELSCFSFHPVKHLTTGEGGMTVTDDADLARRLRVFRNHGLDTDARERERRGTHAYAMVELGWNYRLTDVQCALGLRQLARLECFLARRRALAARYDEALRRLPAVAPLARRAGTEHAFHLYAVLLDPERLSADRDTIFRALRAEGIGVQVHYLPVHLHPYYRKRFGTGPGLCPVAEAAHARLLSLPLFPAMTDADADDVIEALDKVCARFRR